MHMFFFVDGFLDAITIRSTANPHSWFSTQPTFVLRIRPVHLQDTKLYKCGDRSSKCLAKIRSTCPAKTTAWTMRTLRPKRVARPEC